jgi:spore coat protein CotH
MLDGSSSFVTLTILVLALILAVFAMKYAVQILKARTQAAMATQTDARLVSVEKNTDTLDRRVAHLEAMLKDVE